MIPGELFKFLCFERNGNVALKKICSYFDQIQGRFSLSEIYLLLRCLHICKQTWIEFKEFALN